MLQIICILLPFKQEVSSQLEIFLVRNNLLQVSLRSSISKRATERFETSRVNVKQYFYS